MSKCGVPNLRLRRDKVLLLAARRLGSDSLAFAWLRSPNASLDGRTPESLLDTLDGFEQVLEVLEEAQPTG